MTYCSASLSNQEKEALHDIAFTCASAVLEYSTFAQQNSWDLVVTYCLDCVLTLESRHLDLG